jgi:hypothetical protein
MCFGALAPETKFAAVQRPLQFYLHNNIRQAGKSKEKRAAMPLLFV